jgi:hypothetical protein
MSETFLILCRMERDMIGNVYFSSVTCVITCHTLLKSEFSQHIFQKYKNIKIRPRDAGMFLADITKLD